ncbi:MAG: hypothetical protein HQM08_28225 [Candidatus Riflebacteria bacterium]|nr:hypothetical protein [Candidatus Riflebacteria bacterium]
MIKIEEIEEKLNKHSPKVVFATFEFFSGKALDDGNILSTAGFLSKMFGNVLLICRGYADDPVLEVVDRVMIIRYRQLNFKKKHGLFERVLEFRSLLSEIINKLTTPLKLFYFQDPWSGCKFPHLNLIF